MVKIKKNEKAVATASFWYAAWVNAGKPDLVKIGCTSAYKTN
jgi:hypothetical protein